MCVSVILFAANSARAQLTVLGQFPWTQVSTPVSCGFDPTTDRVWVYGAFDVNLFSFSRTGASVGSIPHPGEDAVSCNITFSSSSLTLDGTLVPAGTLLFVNGETGTADIYAVNKGSGSVMATRSTTFGNSQVVGGSYHPGRGTFFLVQDGLPPINPNRVAEIVPSSGSTLGSFSTSALGFGVDFGDVEVGANGNLFVVSSDQAGILEVTPDGVLVQVRALPAGVNSISGLGLDNARGEGWMTGTGGTVWRLGGFPIAAPRPALLVSKGASAAAVLSWAPIATATSYDVVRGDLGILRTSAQRFTAATQGCLGNDVAATPITDSNPLAAGAGRWYLVRATAGGVAGTYDSDSPRQVASRDAGIAASPNRCP